jgi:5-methyltetrahydrofolate--homocysteine methyltransferase
MGTELLQAGATEGECLAAWNLTHPDRVFAIHRAYAQAGARCLVANTFQAHPGVLGGEDPERRAAVLVEAGISLAREAAVDGQFVLASVGPMADPRGQGCGWRRDWLDVLLPALVRADALLFETIAYWNSVTALGRYLRRRRNVLRDLPVLVSMALHRQVSGQPCMWRRQADGNVAVLSIDDCVRWFVRRIERQVRSNGECPFDAIGMNCGLEIGLDESLLIVHALRKQVSLPVLARPNAGTPVRTARRWEYPIAPATFGAWASALRDAGAQLIGGCCGTTPNHVAAMRHNLE